MNKKLYKRLLITALISSPIMALYGITPVYLFNKVPPAFLLFGGTGIMINVFIYWLVNIWLIKFVNKHGKVWVWYLCSYLFVLISHAGLGLLRNRIAPPLMNDMELQIDKHIFIAYPLISILALNTIILIICNAVLASQKNKNAELEIEQLKVNNLEAQKQALLQQLHPHFLFNTLSVLKSLIKENPDEAENYSVKLSEFLRYSIQVQKKDMVTVGEELKFTNDYIDLQKVRFENSLICKINIPEAVYQMQIPAFALQTLVENAIKHNSFTEKQPLHITIEYAANAITISNNKMLAKTTDTTGTGLENLNQRYKIIANKEIEITDGKEEFSVLVHLLNDKRL
jgi:two-component system, LytTR family, sensor kinase